MSSVQIVCSRTPIHNFKNPIPGMLYKQNEIHADSEKPLDEAGHQ